MVTASSHLRQSVQQTLHRGPVGRVGAAVEERDQPATVHDKVASQLQHVFAWVDVWYGQPGRHPASEEFECTLL